MTRITAAILVSLLVLTACGTDPEPTPTAPPAISSTASIRIVSPKQGAVVDADSIPVKIDLDGGRIAEKASNDPKGNRPDVGHMHVILDNKTVSLLEGLEFDLVRVLEDANEPPISKGRHILQAEFATVSHGFFSPRVLSTVTFTVA